MGRMTAGLAERIEQAIWEARHRTRAFTRRFGVWGWSVLALFVISALIGFGERQQKAEMNAFTSRLADQLTVTGLAPSRAMVVQRVDAENVSDGRARLQAFEDHLLLHDDIPGVIQDLLYLAEAEGLKMQRGEYQPRIDPTGGFLRYHMTLPVNGAAPAIHQFMEAALHKHKSLALESVQFKREQIEASGIKARIQWVVLTRLPEKEVRTMAAVSANAGVSK